MTDEKWPYNERSSRLIPEIKAIELVLASKSVNATLERSLRFRLKILSKAWHEAALREMIDDYQRSDRKEAAEALMVALARVRRYRMKAVKRRKKELEGRRG